MRKFDPEPIIELCRLILPLEYPLRVKVYRRRVRGCGDSCGIYTHKNCGKFFSHHIIMVHTENNSRGVETVLAHEYAHAYTVEKHPKAKDHKKSFQRIAKRLENGLKLLGINTGPLYLPGVDK